MSRLAERVAGLVLSTFESLPPRSKPRTYPDGSREWIPMSGVVLACDAETEQERLACVSLATGSKCLPISAIPTCHGMVLHDSHAEVLALRGLNRFFLSEVHAVLCKGDVPYVSPFVSFRAADTYPGHDGSGEHQPFEIRRNVSIWMFSTEAPCGDASMEILMAEKEGNAEPWARAADRAAVLEGRGYFSALGQVRRKPSRGDAEATLSKSCTDKLTLKQVTSVLCFPATLILSSTETAYLAGLIVPSTRYSEAGFQRAFGPRGRLASMQTGHLAPCTQFHPFQTQMLPPDFEPFPFAKTDPARPPVKAGNVSAVWTRGLRGMRADINETIVGGVKQGHRPAGPDPRKASALCRLRLWELVRSLIDALQAHENIPARTRQELLHTHAARTYAELKASHLNAHRQAAKAAATRSLGKWPQNSGDEAWRVERAARSH